MLIVNSKSVTVELTIEEIESLNRSVLERIEVLEEMQKRKGIDNLDYIKLKEINWKLNALGFLIHTEHEKEEKRALEEYL